MTELNLDNVNKGMNYLLGTGLIGSAGTAILQAEAEIRVGVLIVTGIVGILKIYTMTLREIRKYQARKSNEAN